MVRMRTPRALRISAGKNKLRHTKGASLFDKNSRRVRRIRMATDFLTERAEFGRSCHGTTRGRCCPAAQSRAIRGGAQGAHHLVELRDEDAVAGDRLQVVRDGPIRGDPALENDVALVVEKQIAYAGDDRSGLGTAGRRHHVAQGIAILELVDRGGAQHGTDRGKLQGRIVIDVPGQLFDRHVQFCRHAVQKRAGAGGADAAHLRHPNLHGAVEQHGFAVLPADVENGPAIGIVMRGRGDMRRHLADEGVETHETRELVDRLAAGDHRIGDVIPGGAGLGQKIIDRAAPRRRGCIGRKFGNCRRTPIRSGPASAYAGTASEVSRHRRKEARPSAWSNRCRCREIADCP